MKRFWTAIALLCCVIGGGWYNLLTISDTVSSISSTLAQATQQVRLGNTANAGLLFDRAHTLYAGKEQYLSAVVSEKLLDEVRLGFARTEQSIQNGNAEDLTIELADLGQAVDDLLRSEAVSLKNIF
ncbi:MAG: DUF4363 family protein [Eubacteriales bacterium]|nr:DUF4363 family protein [Eubacteriales bacterium]